MFGFRATGMLLACLAGATVAGVADGSAITSTGILLTFDDDAFGASLPAGTIMDDEYQPWGVIVSGTNNNKVHDIAALFDSGNPTGGDDDLETPGYHDTNGVALGHVLIVAENDLDANNDGVLDDPDDEGNDPTTGPFAAEIDFMFDQVFESGYLDVLDIEGANDTASIEPSNVTFLLDGIVVEVIEITGLGDNSVERITWENVLFDQIHVNFYRSGAVDNVFVGDAVPEPGMLALMAVGGAFMGWRGRKIRAKV
ncbi:PEP-CTERM sorting domain-containing protein [Poriferisphaera sp. WC338]|uniref:PEP-CTERM sorting domain-containing protein n=1 Tax=Poriferisphaera sp. WC338 TaxID=3425129 RepID=UPI003D819BFF